MITQSELKEFIHYDPETGLLTWKKLIKGTKIGKIAGTTTAQGYISIQLNGSLYLAHRLAFLYMTGDFPIEHTDHINGIRNDNRWENLRSVTRSENNRNCKIKCNNKSGFNGVSFRAKNKKWVAQIMIEGKQTNLGLFDSPELAHLEYVKIGKKYFGDFFNDGF